MKNVFTRLSRLLIVAVLAISAGGCTTLLNTASGIGDFFTGNDTTNVRLAINLAVADLVSENPEARERIVELTDEATSFVKSNPKAQAEDIIAKVRTEIEWENLEPAKKVLAEEMLRNAERNLKREIEKKEVSEDTTVRVLQVIGWFRKAAASY